MEDHRRDNGLRLSAVIVNRETFINGSHQLQFVTGRQRRAPRRFTFQRPAVKNQHAGPRRSGTIPNRSGCACMAESAGRRPETFGDRGMHQREARQPQEGLGDQGR